MRLINADARLGWKILRHQWSDNSAADIDGREHRPEHRFLPWWRSRIRR
jgi:hypothetical protein